MNRSVKSLVVSILITISIVLVSIPLWRVAQGKDIGSIANNYSDLPITVKVGNFDSLLVVDNEEALSLINPTTIVLRNRNGYKRNDVLYFLVEKKSTIPYSYLRVSINDNIYDISSCEMSEDNENYYFKLEDVEIDAYKTIDMQARIWIDVNVSGLDSKSTLVTNFIVKAER